jgi:putative addiction module antidote
MSSLKIRKVGNSLGVIFSKEIQETLNVSEGDIIDITTVRGNRVVLDSHLQHHSKWKFKNSELNKEDSAWLEADLEDEDEKTPKW